MFRSFGKLFPFIRPQYPRLLLILIVSLALSATAALQPWPLKIIADYAVGGGEFPAIAENALDKIGIAASARNLVFIAATAVLVVFAARMLLDAAIRWLWASAGQSMVYAVSRALFSRLTRLSMQYHARHSIGDSLTRLSTDAYCVYFAVQGSGVTPVQSIFTLLVVGIFAWQLDPHLTVLSFAVAPIIAWTVFFCGRRIREQARAQVEVRSQIAGFVHQSLEYIPLVQSFGTEQQNVARFASLSDDAVRRAQHTSLHKNLLGLGSGAASAGGLSLVLLVGGQRAFTGAITVGTLLIFVDYLRQIQGAMRQLLDVYGLLKQAEANAERVAQVLDSQDQVTEKSGAPALRIVAGAPAVAFDGVRFTYGQTPALHDINFSARQGETIAIVGPTGAGKTTLLSLIPRFLDPQKGRVRLFDQDVRDVKLKSLREHVGLVHQNPFVFAGTVLENIAYGRPDASRNEVIQAAEAANLHRFIESLPLGYDTRVGEHGATLSGGQRQRIAIARALLRDAPILLLDEPTSALDVETEAALLEALERLMRGRTTFIIAHRFSTLRNADRILVLEGGRMRAAGTHDDLVASDALYRRLYGLQGQASRPGVKA